MTHRPLPKSVSKASDITLPGCARCGGRHLCFVLLLFAGHAVAEPPAALSTARQVAESYLLAEPRPPVDLEAVVTGTFPSGTVLLRDETGVTFVSPPDRGEPVQAADRVRVRGVVYDGACINGIADAALEKTGTVPRPEPRRIEPGSLADGSAYHDLVTLTGIGRSVWHHDRVGTVLVVNVARELVEMRCEFPLTVADAERLVDAEVRLTGFGAGEVNGARQVVRPFLRVVTADGIEVVTPAPSDRFAGPAVPLERIDQGLRTAHRVEVTGIAAAPGGTGGGVFIAAGDRGLFVRPAAADAAAAARVAAGDVVEAVGFVAAEGPALALVEAVVRVVGKGTPPAHRRLPDVSMEDKSHEEWFDNFCQVSCDGLPIEVEVDVESRSDTAESTEIVGLMPVTRRRFRCQVPARLPVAAAPGSRVLIRGVCRLTATRPDHFFSLPTAYDMWAVSPADVVVVRAARWWTATRLAWALGGTAVAAAAMLGWALLLRRQVGEQAHELASTLQSQHDAAIEFETALRERNRLAANLHDTVLQTVTGIGYQLQAVQAIGSRDGGVDAGRLVVAGRMVDHAIQQLRGTVWALHALPTGGEPLVASLEALVARLGEGRDTRITCRAEGREVEVSEFVAGNLLLLVQEAITNALRHAAASTIEVAVRFGADGLLTVTVRDEGRGFRVGGQPGPARGHFGIEAMMDRMQAVGGRFRIESREGAGTTVVAEVTAAAEEDLSDRAGAGTAAHG